MKNLSKVIAITAVAAMSFSCLSAYAAGMPEKSGSMLFRPASVRMEMKADAGTNKGKAGNFGGRINDRGMKGEKPEKFEMTEEEKTAKLEELKANLAAKLEAGKITQEKYDETIAAIESGKFKHGGKGTRGTKGEKPEKFEMTEEEKTAKLEELKANLAAKLEAGKITQEKYDETIAAIESGKFMHGGKGMRGMKGGRYKAPDMNRKTDITDNTLTE